MRASGEFFELLKEVKSEATDVVAAAGAFKTLPVILSYLLL
jgi:hypothetical protein